MDRVAVNMAGKRPARHLFYVDLPVGSDIFDIYTVKRIVIPRRLTKQARPVTGPFGVGKFYPELFAPQRFAVKTMVFLTAAAHIYRRTGPGRFQRENGCQGKRRRQAYAYKAVYGLQQYIQLSGISVP
jgi:hypothetical protein